MRLGVDYYPEHWEESRWETDAKLMKDAGLSVVRLAEFSWSKLEPFEGHYNFTWLDKAIDILRSNGIGVILGTPTATPPAWLIERHRDILPLDSRRNVREFGTRLHRCLSNPKMREYSREITRVMVEHYKDNPGVIGWQTDNEFTANECYCDHCAEGFRKWLKEKYGTLDRLNSQWGTIFWSQEYSAWSQVPLPWEAYCGRMGHNPSLLLDYQRFASDTTVSFQKEQVDIIRELSPKQFITHNFMGMHDSMDYFDLAKDLDFVAWDNYPGGGDWFDRPATGSALAHDLTRGLKDKNFWVMEERSGPMGWNVMSPNTRPGEIRMWTWQAVAHGADAVIYFRWRSCLYGTEQYWHGVLNHDGIPRRRYREVAQIGREFAEMGPVLDGSVVKNEVAILNSYDNIWAFKIQPQSEGLYFWLLGSRFHHGFTRKGVGVDVISDKTDFGKYKVLVVPNYYLLAPEVAERLEEFVKAGGTLVTGLRTGVKNWNNICVEQPLPGLIKDISGVEVEEYDAIGKRTNEITADWGSTYTSSVWCDVLNLEGAQSLASYNKDYYAGKPALTKQTYGAGWVYYLGTIPEERFFNDFAGYISKACNLDAVENLPEHVEVAARVKNGKKLRFYINFNRTTVTMEMPEGGKLLLSDEQNDAVPGGKFALSPYGVAIVETEN